MRKTNKSFSKRNFLKLFALTSILALSLCGCGDKKDDDTKETTEISTEAKTTSDNENNETIENTTTPATDNDADAEVYPAPDDMLTGIHHAEINIKDYGVISLELDADMAPITVTNFVLLAKSGFYDGLTFHRIMSGFMMQGGDPEGNGFGGSEHEIYGEYPANGWDKNTISHKRGVISMARNAYDMNSASSQFFIMHVDYPGLDGQYAAFGHVTEGIEIVDKICEDAEPTDNNGTILAENQPVINSVKILD